LYWPHFAHTVDAAATPKTKATPKKRGKKAAAADGEGDEEEETPTKKRKTPKVVKAGADEHVKTEESLEEDWTQVQWYTFSSFLTLQAVAMVNIGHEFCSCPDEPSVRHGQTHWYLWGLRMATNLRAGRRES
jgi:hypothetical protein